MHFDDVVFHKSQLASSLCAKMQPCYWWYRNGCADAERLHLSRSVTFSIKMQGQCQQQIFLTQSAAPRCLALIVVLTLCIYMQPLIRRQRKSIYVFYWKCCMRALFKLPHALLGDTKFQSACNLSLENVAHGNNSRPLSPVLREFHDHEAF
jgi:hypothetical protein